MVPLDHRSVVAEKYSTSCSSLATIPLVSSYILGIAVFEKYFRLGSSNWGSKVRTILLNPGFSTEYNGNESFGKQKATDSVSHCHFLLVRA